ncbi:MULTISPECIES: CHAT domain-containing tetratricopeptide repeat protein [unclassified Microcoleus]|uniref:CHAT domain-containing protein n=1 Tax=unclassified Microcoleus TaxID=2642155 RepID=UPI0025E87640|nr:MULTISPECIES: CHAT domain-containing tetratricopeptide repeat protein [unclassified Microcoleus]
MEENRIAAYLQLIHTLLNCPNGDEPQILQDNSELLDRGFLETCESVAAKLAAQGGENGANFLRNLASQLGQFIDMNDERDSNNSQGENPQEYANFILELLQAEEASKGDIKVIHTMLDQREHLLNPRFAEILEQLAENLIDQHPKAIEHIVALIEDLSSHINQFPRGNRANNIEIAITGYQIVLSNREPGSEKFAQTKNNLANAYYSRINGSRAENLEEAIFCYQEALQVRTREASPQDWATTQNNLAAAYYSRIKGDKADNIEKAIASFTAALEIRTRNREDFPERLAETQNNLGEAYRQRIRGEKADNIEIAIAFYKAALEVYTSDNFPKRWAETQNNLGEAYRERIRGEKADNIERAISFYNAALEVFTREAFPEYWATTQNNLAIAYCQRISGEKADNIKMAIAVYNLVLQISTREHFPLENVETLNNLGFAYLAKLDNINQEKPEDTNQRAVTLQSAYDTFKNAITGASKLRELESGDETKQKHDWQWDQLYRGMVQVCLDRQNNQEALEYAEANKARNLAEVIAQKQETPQVLKPITFTEITQLLTPNTALIEWYITDAEIITFVLTYPDVLIVHRNPQCAELIDLVNDYRADYKQSKTHWQTKLSDYLQRLAEILQITTILPSESTRLILIPHWLLHLFPLHALPLSDDEFLLDRFTQGIQYSPSCQLLQQITIHPNFDQLLALQNPTSDLPYTDLEVASIAPKFAISQILPGSQASKTNLLEQYLEQLENAHCAHFSCHGSFNADEPLKSFLILSGGIIAEDPVGVVPPCLPQDSVGVVPPCLPLPTNEGGHGGTAPTNADEGGHGGTAPTSIAGDPVGVVPPCLPLPERYVEWREGKTADIDKCLTLAEIFGLRFKQCRLVVLSACETALIDTQNRSDYIGLPTGFLYAGAMGTLASLWAVNDLSTALMMVKFYEVLKPGVSIGQALHDTQRWFKSATASDLLEWVEGSDSFDGEQKEDVTEYLGRYPLTKKPYGDVYHWGAFCAIGL